jgi:hypothetical protein
MDRENTRGENNERVCVRARNDHTKKGGLMTNGKSPKSRGDLHENATAKQIPKQDLRITSKIKPREKHRQGTSKRKKKNKTHKTYTKGIGHGESEGQESMCGWI